MRIFGFFPDQSWSASTPRLNHTVPTELSTIYSAAEKRCVRALVPDALTNKVGYNLPCSIDRYQTVFQSVEWLGMI